MQAVQDYSPALGSFRFAGGRSYMMRSEKRGYTGPSHRSPAPGKPPRRRRNRAGFFYKLFMLLLLLTVWPVGLLMLWRRKVRWGALTKLLTSIVTLAACIVLIGFALTVNTENAQYTAVQDSINSFLDDAADVLVNAGEIIGEKAEIILEGMDEVSGALWESGKLYLADGIDAGVLLAQQAKTEVSALIESMRAQEAAEETAEEPAAVSTDAAEETAEETAAPEAAETDKPAETTETVEAADLTVNADATELPVFTPGASPEAGEGQEIAEGMLSRTGELTEGEVAPTVEPTVNVLPTATLEPLVFTVKSAEDATVFYNDGGKCYHKTSACASMKTSVEHTLGETRDVKNHRCTICGTPEKSILDETHIVWTDDQKTAHLSDECAAFSGMWNLIPAAEAIEGELTACRECSADLYLRAVEAELDVVIERPVVTPEPTEEPTAEPTEKPTEKPTPQITKAPTEKPASEATKKPASEATEKPTEKPASEATKKPASEATKKPAAKASEKPAA